MLGYFVSLFCLILDGIPEAAPEAALEFPRQLVGKLPDGQWPWLRPSGEPGAQLIVLAHPCSDGSRWLPGPPEGPATAQLTHRAARALGCRSYSEILGGPADPSGSDPRSLARSHTSKETKGPPEERVWPSTCGTRRIEGLPRGRSCEPEPARRRFISIFVAK